MLASDIVNFANVSSHSLVELVIVDVLMNRATVGQSRIYWPQVEA